jgi:outer membrane protein OmpA-like peptidoglycan-associated protein
LEVENTMLHITPAARIVRPIAVIAAVALCGACARAAGGAKQAVAAPAPATKPSAPAAAPATTVASKARTDSINRANAVSFAELRREAARSDSLNRASMALVTRQSELREALVAQVHFDLDQSKIREADRSLMDRKAAILTANSTVRLRITGYAYERPSADDDRALGERRAEEARQYLAAHGVDTTRIAISSNGNEHRLCLAKTESCELRNRRVDFYIVDAPNRLRFGAAIAK